MKKTIVSVQYKSGKTRRLFCDNEYYGTIAHRFFQDMKNFYSKKSGYEFLSPVCFRVNSRTYSIQTIR